MQRCINVESKSFSVSNINIFVVDILIYSEYIVSSIIFSSVELLYINDIIELVAFNVQIVAASENLSACEYSVVLTLNQSRFRLFNLDAMWFVRWKRGV